MNTRVVLESNHALESRLLALDAFKSADSVMLFSPFGTEPTLERTVAYCREKGKQLILPRMIPGNRLECRAYESCGQLVPGPFGILEPDESCPLIERDAIAFILVPAVCYDKQGGRLGHGAGYYDRFLDGYRGVTAGLCRNCFLQEHVPMEPHDVRVRYVLTEERVIDCSSVCRQE